MAHVYFTNGWFVGKGGEARLYRKGHTYDIPEDLIPFLPKDAKIVEQSHPDEGPDSLATEPETLSAAAALFDDATAAAQAEKLIMEEAEKAEEEAKAKRTPRKAAK